MNHWQVRQDSSDTKASTDVRTEWARDYARLIHSPFFRRLQSKTQVLGLGESDFYRTRLTHSMEVAQIGVGIVDYLKLTQATVEDKGFNLDVLPCSSLMGSICLAHDLGHPPFGHGGEVALNMCMRDSQGFEGNGQTLRILSKLDHYSKDHGLNPTRRLLFGVLKYPVSYSQVVNEQAYEQLKEPLWLNQAKHQLPPKCYLDSEKAVVDWILKPFEPQERMVFLECYSTNTHHKAKYKGLDASIMELADDISYGVHDLEDAISLQLIDREDWEEYLKDKKDLFIKLDLDFNSITERLFSKQSYQRKKQIGRLVHHFISSINLMSVDDQFTHYLLKYNAQMNESSRQLLDAILKLVFDKVIQSTNVQQLEFKGQKIIVELFNVLSSDPKRLLPKSTLVRYEQEEENKNRVLCDYIAGMTDEYATRLYEKIYHPNKGSIFDRL